MMRRRGESGIALVIVLWVGILIAAIAGAFVLDTRTSARLTRNFVNNAEARALADGGVYLAVFELLHPDPAAPWRRDGRRYRRTVPGGVLEIAIEDEAGKINLNLASDALLESLFLSAGMTSAAARSLVGSIVHSRTVGDMEMLRLQLPAASAGQTRSRIEVGGALRRTFTHRYIAVDALGQLPNVTANLYARLRPALTVYGRSGSINYVDAPREVLQAVPGVPPDAVNQFLTERSRRDDVAAALARFLSLGQARKFWRKGESNFVTVKVLAHTGNGAKFARIAVVEIPQMRGQAFSVHEWREGDVGMFRATPRVPLMDKGRRGNPT